MIAVGESWAASVRALGGDAGRCATSSAELEAAYSAPARRYHGTAHILAVLRDAAALGAELQLSPRDQALVAAAACAHDVVYRGRAREDEQASADWAIRALLAAGVEQAAAERVAGLVLATADHAAPDGDPAARVLLDADLAILGSSPEAYRAYTAAVRAEYAQYDEDQWRAGRCAVLIDLLGRARLYATDAGHRRWDEAARRNLRAELTALGGPA
jgi:predicted metal-dependent HD superfamily phosphohydrolase